MPAKINNKDYWWLVSIIIILACSVYIILETCMKLEKVYQGCELMLCVS